MVTLSRTFMVAIKGGYGSTGTLLVQIEGGYGWTNYPQREICIKDDLSNTYHYQHLNTRINQDIYGTYRGRIWSLCALSLSNLSTGTFMVADRISLTVSRSGTNMVRTTLITPHSGNETIDVLNQAGYRGHLW